MMSARNRYGEDGSVPNREDRFFQKQDYWYFNTREGLCLGPYDSKTEAVEGVMEYIDFVDQADAHTLAFLNTSHCA